MEWLVEQLREMFFFIFQWLIDWAVEILQQLGISYDTTQYWNFADSFIPLMREWNGVVRFIDFFAVISAAWGAEVVMKATRKVVRFVLNRSI